MTFRRCQKEGGILRLISRTRGGGVFELMQLEESG